MEQHPPGETTADPRAPEVAEAAATASQFMERFESLLPSIQL